MSSLRPSLGRLHVLPVVSDFLAAFSEINVQLALSDRNVHLIDDHVDAAVRIRPLADMSLIATRVGFVRRVVCGSPAHSPAHGAPKSPADLSDLACVTFDVLGSPVSWNFPSQASKANSRCPSARACRRNRGGGRRSNSRRTTLSDPARPTA